MVRCLLIFLLLGGNIVHAQLFPHNYHRTYRYSSGGWTASETYFTDISDAGVVCGYYKNESGTYSGLIYKPTGKTITYNHPGYTNTEITGVNASGYVVGRAYNSPGSAIVWRGNIGADTLFGITEVTWYYTGATFQNPKGMNAEGVISGSIQTGTSRWLNNVSAVPPVVMSDTKRYQSGSTFCNTYGLGISDAANSNISAGFYLDGSENKPFLFTPADNTFHNYVHREPSPGIPGTKFNDVNNSTHLAVSYKTTSGIWQGTVASADVVFNTVVYDYSFPFTGTQGSAVLGINNHDDIAGWFKNNDTVTAYFALVREQKIPDFELPDYSLSFSNGDDGFFKTLLYDEDPWLLNGDPFYDWYLAPCPWLSPEDKTELQAGHRYPDWVQYVMAATPDSAYMTDDAGNVYPTPDAMGRWLSESKKTYNGYCYGLTAFTAQYLSNQEQLENRFPEDLTYFPDYPYLYTTTGPQFEELVDVLAALYQYQNNVSLEELNDIWDARITAFQEGTGAAQYDTLRQELDYMAEQFYKPLSQDSLRLMSIWFTEAPVGTPTEGAHSILPYKLSRYPSLSQHLDTLFAYDPNKPGTHMKVLIDYDNHTMKLLNASDEPVAILGTLHVSDPLTQIGIAAPLKLSYRQTPAAGPLTASKTYGSYHSVQPSGSCSYTLRNTAIPSQYFQQTGTTSANNFPDLFRRFREDAGPVPEKLLRNGPLNITTTLTGCEGHRAWNYGYPAGNMIYARQDAGSDESDLIWNNEHYLQAANPDGATRHVSLSAISVAGSEQTLLITDSLELQSGDTLSLTATDTRQFLLKNNNAHPCSYDLHVRHVGAVPQILRNLQDIPFTANTNHTILVQPDAAGSQQVLILVDQFQDGTIDDTLYVTAGPTGIHHMQGSGGFRCFPNPARDLIQLQSPGLTSGWSYRVSDLTGRTIATGIAGSSSVQIDTRGWAPGLYITECFDKQQRPAGRLRVVKQ